MEWHLNWNTKLLPRFYKRPCKCESIFTSCKCQVTTCRNWANSQTLFTEKIQFCWHMDIWIVTKTKLTFFISSPSYQILSVLKKYNCSVFRRYYLLTLNWPILIKNVYGYIILNCSNVTWILDNYFVVIVWIFCALTIIIPAPTVSFATTITSNWMGSSHLQFH
jgi:hypothetical protein